MFDKLKKINENQPIKKFNYPVMIAPVGFFIEIIFVFICIIKIEEINTINDTALYGSFIIFIITIILFLLLSISCPVCLYFQIDNKQKTVLDKIFLTANVIYSTWVITFLIPTIFFIIIMSFLFED